MFALPLNTTSTQLPSVCVCRYLVTKRLVVVRLSTIINNRKKIYVFTNSVDNDKPVIKKATVTEYPSNDYQQVSGQNRAIILLMHQQITWKTHAEI